MSDYAHVPGGSLKFKGGGEKKKKKKSSLSTSDRSRVDSGVRQSEKKDKGKSRDRYREEREDSNEIVIKKVAPGEGRKMTDAEKRFEETQRIRREERAKRTATQSHKDRVAEYNAKLERLSEHHDMPKIGPG